MSAGRLQRLAVLAGLPERRVLGLMSGTSQDGLELALCRIRGTGLDTALTVEQHASAPFDADTRARLRALISVPQVPLADLTVLHAWLGRHQGTVARQMLADWGVAKEAVHLLVAHGITVYHAPLSWQDEAGRTRTATLQVGDGDHLAQAAGILTVTDLRQKEVAGGGQGAPLAPYAERLLFSAERPRVLLNLGGIANASWLPARGEDAWPLAGDTGPANTLIDRAYRHHFPRHAHGYDRDGAVAAKGRVHAGLLAALRAHPYFAQRLPKSTGPELFGQAYLDAAHAAAGSPALPREDWLATLTRLTAETVAGALRANFPRLAEAELIASGGGVHNRTLMAALAELLPELPLRTQEVLGMPPEAKEAALWALLAHESLFGEGFRPLHDPSAPPLALGKLSWPD